MKKANKNNQSDTTFRFQVIEDKGDEVVIEVSPEDYARELAAGVSPDETLSPGRHVGIRGGFLKRHPNFNPATVETVVHISLGLDLEVLKYFKQLAVETNADSYETPIKQALREAMEKARPTRQAVTERQALIEDPQFIEAVAERVRKLSKKSSAKPVSKSSSANKPRRRASQKTS
ncbi:MAG: hypothetical protein SF097_13075 [Acidobacteriota bacterium]|nr:hypothetical protein [Acidobacteriota bacterium]